MSLWVSQADPAILAGLLAVPEVVAVRSCADPHDPSLALNSRRSLYSLRQWRDSQHLLFDREPTRWTSNEQR
jgi:hypothetical protein